MKRDAPLTAGEIFYTRTFALITLAVVGFLLYSILLPFLAPIAWALFIAFLLHPTQHWLVGVLRGRENVAAASLTVITILIIIGPVTALGAAFAAQVAELLQYAQQLAADHGPSTLSDLTKVPILGTALIWTQETFGISFAQIQSWIVDGASAVLHLLASMGGKIFLGAVGTAIGFILTMFLLFFMIRDAHRLLATLRALIPASTIDKNRLFRHLAAVTRAMVYGTGVTAIAQGTLVAIGFAIVALPSPIVFGVLAAFFALVPMAGTPVVWAPAVLVLAAQQRWGAAAFLLVWGVFVVTIDNVLRPLLVSGRANVDTLTVFVGVLGGVSAFGAIGIFLGPVVLALVIALIRFSLEIREVEIETPARVNTSERRRSARDRRATKKEDLGT